MKTVKFHNNYYKLARQYKRAFTFSGKHTITVWNWADDDVRQQFEMYKEDGETPLTLDEIDYILYRMFDNHDAEMGINWDVISCYVNEIRDAREKGESL